MNRRPWMFWFENPETKEEVSWRIFVPDTADEKKMNEIGEETAKRTGWTFLYVTMRLEDLDV